MRLVVAEAGDQLAVVELAGVGEGDVAAGLVLEEVLVLGLGQDDVEHLAEPVHVRRRRPPTGRASSSRSRSSSSGSVYGQTSRPSPRMFMVRK